MNSSTASELGPTVEETTCQARFGNPAGADRGEAAGVQLELDRLTRLKRDPQPHPGGVLDRAVRPKREQRRVKLVRVDIQLAQAARPRSLLAHQPWNGGELVDGDPRAPREEIVGRSDEHELVVEERNPLEVAALGGASRTGAGTPPGGCRRGR